MKVYWYKLGEIVKRMCFYSKYCVFGGVKEICLESAIYHFFIHTITIRGC